MDPPARELQATDEELETMNEELQFTDEEPETIDDEVRQPRRVPAWEAAR